VILSQRDTTFNQEQCGLSMFRGTCRDVMESHVSVWSSLHLCKFTFCALSGHVIFL